MGVTVESLFFLSVQVTRGSHCCSFQLGERNISVSVAVMWALVKCAELNGDFGWDFELHSRTDLINSSGCEGKLRASVPQQRNKTPVISSSSSLHSSQALMSCLGNLRALRVHVCVSEHERGLEKPQSENDVSSERIKSPLFSQGCGILLLSCLTVLVGVNTHPCTL